MDIDASLNLQDSISGNRKAHLPVPELFLPVLCFPLGELANGAWTFPFLFMPIPDPRRIG
jgi:hypothetical protein